MSVFRNSLLALTLLCAPGLAIAESCTYGDAQAPVRIFAEAMKAYRFDDAYAVLTDNMTDGLDREAWAAGQRKLFTLGQVVIGEIDVRWPQHIGNAACTKRALVPNVLAAKDRFNNQGSVEFELYTVINDGVSWKIDAQETLIEESLINQWFPGDEIPEFKDQLHMDDILPGDEDL